MVPKVLDIKKQWDATNNQGQTVSAEVCLYTIQVGCFKQTKK